MQLTYNFGDKWIQSGTRGWIIYRFEKPILIRGYALVSASIDGEKAREPRDWELFVQDSVRPES